MIPLEIRLTNFLSYREQAVVDLRAVHLACISGANGAGKSSLLDAMTWALFGKSRVRSDDDLVHTAANSDEGAEVEFLFDMEGAPYRVWRRKRANKSTELEFQVGEEGDREITWHSLTESRIRETQVAVERVLRMNYDVFVNASFFLQGQADEFTSRTPGRRKEILAEVLGVTQWDAYSKLAGSERRETETESQVIGRRMEEVVAELAEAEERQRQLEEATAQAASAGKRLDDKQQLLQQAQQIQKLIDQQEKQADGYARDLLATQRDLERLQQVIADRSRELARHETVVADEPQIEADFKAWSVADAAFQKWQSLADKAHKLEQQQHPLTVSIAAERSRLEQQLQGLKAQEESVAAGAVEKETLRSDLESWQRDLADLEEQAKALSTKETRLRDLEMETQRLAGERQRFEQDLQRLSGELERVEAARAERPQVQSTLDNAQARVVELSKTLDDLGQRGEQAAGWVAEREQMIAQRTQLEAEAEREKARIEQLKSESGAECPLCGQPLTASHRDDVVQQLEEGLEQKRQAYRQARERETWLKDQLSGQGDLAARRDRLQQEYRAEQQKVSTAVARLEAIDQAVKGWAESGNDARISELKTWLDKQPPLAETQTQLDLLQKELAQKPELDEAIRTRRQQITRAESRLEQIERQTNEWETAGRLKMETAATQLESDQFALEERRLLAELQQEMDALAYDPDQHEAARVQRQTLIAAPERHQALGQAQAALKPIREALAEFTSQQTAMLAKQAEQKTQHETALAALQSLQETAVDPVALEDEVIRLREELSRASQIVGAAKQKVDVLEDRRQQTKELEKTQRKLDRRIQQLKMLEEACGRNGVQALLIEHALPEIEERANQLLDRLSGGAMRVTFETQRELKSREATAETLEIHIADSAGERPYENYSGGEQFRVNFAVRLALSQVLAHRAGARLRTLVIDEGFGSQDPEGRQRLVEAINAIQSDFDCVLVITHIDELRDAFPARIEVTKTNSGSHVNVVAGL
ncbi:MAG: SMC family ATPase [Chloroflexota bacterium]